LLQLRGHEEKAVQLVTQRRVLRPAQQRPVEIALTVRRPAFLYRERLLHLRQVARAEQRVEIPV
jgi:hypothetical protein